MDANEMRRQIDLIILTLETSRQALLKEEIKPMPNPLEGDGLGIGEAMIQADVLRREGMRDALIRHKAPGRGIKGEDKQGAA